MVKHGPLIALMTLSALVWPAFAEESTQPIVIENSARSVIESSADSAAAPQSAPSDKDPINWVDTSHAYATDRAQDLTEWVDDFFGDPSYELDQAESQLRLEWRSSWDQQDNFNTKLRLRGQLQLPKISKRLNLVFSGEDGDDITADERAQEGRAGLVFNVEDRRRSRLDLTLTGGSGGIRPGVRYRNKGPFGENYYYRYTQRVEWEDDEGFYTRGQLNLDYALSDTRLVRLRNRVIYGEETYGTEWRTTLSHSEIHRPKHAGDRVMTYFTSIEGFTDPSLIENYNIGAAYRRQIYRRYLYVEVIPSYNWRKRIDDGNRDGVWNIELRFEIALQRDLRRMKSSRKKLDSAATEPATLPPRDRTQGHINTLY